MDVMAKRRALALSMRAVALAAAALICGCYGFAPVSIAGPDTPDVPLDQAGRGEALYASGCAGCHGERGEGTDGRPALIGENTLPLAPPSGAETRKGEMKTAADLFAFIKSDMPPIAPGSVPDDEAWAIVAFLVKERGKAPAGGAEIGPRSASTVELR